MGEPNSGLVFDVSFLQPELSEQDKAIRQRFVEEYLKDFQPLQACSRLGFQLAYANAFAKQFMGEPYVHWLVMETLRSRSVDSEDEIEQDRRLIIRTYREAAQKGPYNSRVSAANALAKLRGWPIEQSEETGEEDIINALRDFASKAPL